MWTRQKTTKASSPESSDQASFPQGNEAEDDRKPAAVSVDPDQQIQPTLPNPPDVPRDSTLSDLANTQANEFKLVPPQMASVVTPQRPQNAFGKYCTLFVYDGGQQKRITKPATAKRFEAEYGDSIENKLAFDTQQEFNLHQQASNDVPDRFAPEIKIEGMSSGDQALIAKIKRRRLQDTPTRSINMFWKTTGFTAAVIILLEIRDPQGKHAWFFKARDFVDTIKACVREGAIAIHGTHTREIIMNLEYMQRRDALKGENAVAHSKKGSNKYELYNPISHFVLPLGRMSFANSAEEQAYILNALNATGTELKAILSSDLYNACLKDTILSYSEKLAEAAFSTAKGPNIQGFMTQAVVKIKPVVNFTDHVIKDRVPYLRRIMSRHDVDEKYGPDAPESETAGLNASGGAFAAAAGFNHPDYSTASPTSNEI